MCTYSVQIWRNQHRSVVISTVPSIQLDSLSQRLEIGMYRFAGMDLQLFSLNFLIKDCVIIAYLVEFHPITKILLTLREITKKLPKMFNYQKSPQNREILPKVIKITKSGHTGFHSPNKNFLPNCSKLPYF
jgi:hypothetical protein